MFPKLKPTVKALQAKQHVVSVGAPIGGLNARDGIGTMPETDALELENWIPQPIGLKCRKGYSAWTDDSFAGPVRTIFQHFAPTDQIPLSLNYAIPPESLPGRVFAADDNVILDITDRNVVSLELALSGNDYAGQLCTNMFANAAGSFSIINSEADGYILFDGSTFDSTPGVTGVNENNLVFNLPYKHRIWFVERDSSSLWYLDTDAVIGPATEFPVGPLLKHGGAVAYIANWTIDAGDGVDDHLVIVGVNGDVLIYKGVDPDDPNNWALVGSWYIGPVPAGRRAFTQYGGDLVLLSVNGLFPVSYITRGGADFLQATNKEYTSKIQNMITADLAQSYNLYGWEITLCPRYDLMIITVPDNNAVVSKQYALNTITNQWTTFSGMPIQTVANCSGWVMFGTPTGLVKMAFSSFFDDVAIDNSGGVAIEGYIVPAFSYFGNLGAYKHFLMVRPTFLAVIAPGLEVRMCVDFNVAAPSQTPVYVAASGALWDIGLWDTAAWDGPSTTHQRWIGVVGAGYSGCLAMVTVCSGDTLLNSIDYMMEIGGPM